ncbi:hypothetical protein NPIL_645301 [Nephila pilipes]|uniref:Uncharacterized protein n=1 Tax=Nephila pilipes TaxID=299642 RepID=A0A8X6QXE1_NEPPI|nr:hypothetical protein NPIL_645301 [Nephila pilipes]
MASTGARRFASAWYGTAYHHAPACRWRCRVFWQRDAGVLRGTLRALLKGAGRWRCVFASEARRAGCALYGRQWWCSGEAAAVCVRAAVFARLRGGINYQKHENKTNKSLIPLTTFRLACSSGVFARHLGGKTSNFKFRFCDSNTMESHNRICVPLTKGLKYVKYCLPRLENDGMHH